MMKAFPIEVLLDPAPPVLPRRKPLIVCLQPRARVRCPRYVLTECCNASQLEDAGVPAELASALFRDYHGIVVCCAAKRRARRGRTA